MRPVTETSLAAARRRPRQEPSFERLPSPPRLIVVASRLPADRKLSSDVRDPLARDRVHRFSLPFRHGGEVSNALGGRS
jgi:hypothetical protein